MHIPGHIAVALSQYTLPPLSKRPKLLLPVLLATLFPDLIDKTLGYILHAIPGGRHAAHNIFSLVGTTFLVSLVWESVIGMAWFLGYLGHLLVDNPRRVPWFFPVKKYPFRVKNFNFDWQQFWKELLFLALAVVIYRIGQQKGTNTHS